MPESFHPGPRVRLLLALLLALAVAVLRRPQALLAAAVAVAIVVSLAGGLPTRLRPWRRLLAVNGFILLLALTLPFSTPGEACWRLGPLTATGEGVALAAMIALKANLIALAWMALVASLSPMALGQALHGLGLPRKLVWLMVLVERYEGILAEEWRRLATAARARGFVPRSDRFTYATYARMFGTLLLRSSQRAGRVGEAMRCRGFSGAWPLLPLSALSARDIAWLLLGLAAAAAMALAEWAKGVPHG